MNKKLLLVLFIALAISTAAYFYIQKKNKDKSPLNLVTDPVPKNSTIPADSNVRTPNTGSFPLKFGSRGKAVQFLQVMVGVTPDSIWGNTTDIAVKKLLAAVKDQDNQISKPEFTAYTLSGIGGVSWPLYQGSKGNYVKALQIMLGQKIDGIFGPVTAQACKHAYGYEQCTETNFKSLMAIMLNSI